MDVNHYDDAKIALIESRCKSNTHRINELAEHQVALDRLVASVEVLATKQETVEGDVKEIKEDVKTMTGKAGKRWVLQSRNTLSWTNCLPCSRGRSSRG